MENYRASSPKRKFWFAHLGIWIAILTVISCVRDQSKYIKLDDESCLIVKSCIARHYNESILLVDETCSKIVHDRSFSNVQDYIHTEDPELARNGVGIEIIDDYVKKNYRASSLRECDKIQVDFIGKKAYDELDNGAPVDAQAGSIRPGKRCFMKISNVGWTKNHDFAAISYSLLGDRGAIEIYRKENGNWEYFFSILPWVS